jgi:hypothetical protein
MTLHTHGISHLGVIGEEMFQVTEDVERLHGRAGAACSEAGQSAVRGGCGSGPEASNQQGQPGAAAAGAGAAVPTPPQRQQAGAHALQMLLRPGVCSAHTTRGGGRPLTDMTAPYLRMWRCDEAHRGGR